MKRFLPLAVILIIPSCLLGCDRDDDEDKLLPLETTPNGYKVHWFERGSTDSGWFTKDQAFAWFDSAMARAILHYQTVEGEDPKRVEAVAKSKAWYLHDSSWFWTDKGGALGCYG